MDMVLEFTVQICLSTVIFSITDNTTTILKCTLHVVVFLLAITWKQEPSEQVLTFLWGQKKDTLSEVMSLCRRFKGIQEDFLLRGSQKYLSIISERNYVHRAPVAAFMSLQVSARASTFPCLFCM